MEPPTFEATLHELREILPYLLWGALGLAGVFVLLMLVRLWGWRTQKRGGACGGIDLDALRRQYMAGEISEEEYEAVRRSIVGAEQETPPAAAVRPAASAAPVPPTGDTETPAEPSIEPDGEPHDGEPPHTDNRTNDRDEPGDGPERRRTDGEA